VETNSNNNQLDVQNFKKCTDFDSLVDKEKAIAYYIKKLIDDSATLKNFEFYINFNAKDYSFYVENKKIYFEIPPIFSYEIIKFEIYKIDYLIKYPISRTIYGIWPGFYKYNNTKFQFFYLIAMISFLTFSYIFSKTFLGIIITVSFSLLIFIYIVFLINLFVMLVHVGIHSRCYNEICINRAKGKYCFNCEMFLRKNPFLLIGAPKVIIQDFNEEIGIEMEYFLHLIVSNTTVLKKFARIIFIFNIYYKHVILDPFSIRITLPKNVNLKKIVNIIFNLDFYLSQRISRDRQFMFFYDINKITENKTENFIKKYSKVYNLIKTINVINSNYPNIEVQYNFDKTHSIEGKIKFIAKTKLKKLVEIDRDLAQELIKNLNDNEFNALL